MQRCLQLAALGMGQVAPNPMVGAVLVHEGHIIGEGYHKVYGGPHAEVVCFNSVEEKHRSFIGSATLYVSLEPCAHYGKTPPCADLIISHRVSRVVVGCVDPYPAVAGKGIEKMKAAGINIITGILEEECRNLNKRFFTFHREQRPYVILKWAQTLNGKMSGANKNRIKISNAMSDRLVHRWRSEEASILVGTNTALIDDPTLTTRLVPGKNPVRIVIDKELRLPPNLKVFDASAPTIIYNSIRSEERGNLSFIKLESDDLFLQQMMTSLHALQIQSVIVEGGAALLQSFINESLWDEARIITNNEMYLEGGLDAPLLTKAQLFSSEIAGTDAIRYFKQ